jgi:hypothetical protein
MHKRKAMHMLLKELATPLRKSTTHKAHKRSAPLGEAKGLDTTGKGTKEHKTHKHPLNTCTRAKEHTKLTLNACDRA